MSSEDKELLVDLLVEQVRPTVQQCGYDRTKAINILVTAKRNQITAKTQDLIINAIDVVINERPGTKKLRGN